MEVRNKPLQKISFHSYSHEKNIQKKEWASLILHNKRGAAEDYQG